MIADLDPGLLRTFIASVETMSFTKAATLVHKSPATVSMQIAKLEDRLGTALFIRDTRNLKLTRHGEELFGYAQRMLRLHNEAVDAIRRPEIAGTVTIGAPDDYISCFLPPVLSRFGAQFPKVELNVVCAQTTAMLPMVRQGDIDLAVVTRTGNCGGTLLRCEPMVWISSPGKEALARNPLPVALYEPGSEARSATLAALTRGNIRHRSAYSSFSQAGLLAIVEAGLAIAAVVQLAAPPGLVQLDQADGLPPIAPLDIVLVRSSQSNRASCDALADTILATTKQV